MFLLACDSTRMVFKIPRECHALEPKYCVSKLGVASLHLAHMFQANARNAFWICLNHEHMEMEKTKSDMIELNVKLTTMNTELANEMLRKTDELAAINEKYKKSVEAAFDNLETKMKSHAENMDQQLEGLGQHVESKGEQILQMVDGIGHQVNETNNAVVDGNMKIIAEVKGMRWGKDLFWFTIDLLERWTGWSRVSLSILAMVAISMSAIIWCFVLNNKQKLLVLCMIAAIGSGISNMQAIHDIVSQYWKIL